MESLTSLSFYIFPSMSWALGLASTLTLRHSLTSTDSSFEYFYGIGSNSPAVTFSLNSFISPASNGFLPVAISYSVTPSDQTSIFGPYSSSFHT